jgi:hypothetical protein
MTARSFKVPDLRVLVEPLAGWGERRRDVAELRDVPVGEGVRSLDVDSFAALPRLVAARRDRAPGPRALQLEALSVERGSVLLVITPPSVAVRVNGARAPRVAVLRVGDQIQLPEAILHVTEYRNVTLGSPSGALVGGKCDLCRGVFDERTVVLVHGCGSALHLEPESKPAAERLECALLGCPNCEEPVSLESGFSYLPEI